MNKIKKLLSLILFVGCVLVTACKIDFVEDNEKASTLVKLNPLVTFAERTALPDVGAVQLSDLSSVYLYLYDTEEAYLNNNFDKSWGSYNSIQNFKSASFEVPEGTYYFVLRASNGNIYYRSAVYASVTAENNTLSFELKPTDESNYYNGTVKLKFLFPEGTNPDLESFKWERYSRTDVLENYGTKTKADFTTYVSNVSEGIPYIEMSFSLYKNNWKNDFLLKFVFVNKEESEVTGIYEYTTSTSLFHNKEVSEEFTVQKFMPVQVLKYHLTDAANISSGNDEIYTEYYSPVFGYSLYNTRDYTWYEDKDCTVKAASKKYGESSGQKEFYWTAEKNKRTLTLKDFAGNLIGERTINNGTSYYFDLRYMYTDNQDNVDLKQDGYYIDGFYSDTNKTKQYYTNTSYYLEEDLTLYLEYKPALTITIYEVNASPADEPIFVGDICGNYYKLYTNYLYSHYSQYYGFNIVNFYSDVDGNNALSKDTQYTCEENVVIYAEKDIPHTLTVKDVITEETLQTLTINNRQLTFYDNSIGTYNTSYSFSTYVYKYYYDKNGANEIAKNNTLTGITTDLTVYAHCPTTSILVGTDQTTPWASDTVSGVATGYYSYTVTEDGDYNVYLTDVRGDAHKDNYFYIFINNEYETETDDPSGERIQYSLSAGAVITIKHTLYDSNYRFGGGDNMEPIPDYATNIYDADIMRVEKMVIPPLTSN